MGEGHDPVTARIRRDDLRDLLDTMVGAENQRITAVVEAQAPPPEDEPARTIEDDLEQHRRRAETLIERPTTKHAQRRKTPSSPRQPEVVVRFAPTTGSHPLLAIDDAVQAVIAAMPRPRALPIGTTATPPLARPDTAQPWADPTPAIVAPPRPLPGWIYVAASCALTALVVTLLMLLL